VEEKKGFQKRGEVRLEQIIDRAGRRLVGKGEIFIGEGYWEIFGCRKMGCVIQYDFLKERFPRLFS